MLLVSSVYHSAPELLVNDLLIDVLLYLRDLYHQCLIVFHQFLLKRKLAIKVLELSLPCLHLIL